MGQCVCPLGPGSDHAHSGRSTRRHCTERGRRKAVLKRGKKKKRVRSAHRNERSRGRSVLHGQDMGKTQNHRNSIEQYLAVDGNWRLADGGGWRLAVGGGWRRMAFGS